MNKIFIVQHCQSEHHINELTGGWTDTPLTELGRMQAKEVAKELKILGVDEDFILYSSDLKRARMTSEAIQNYFKVDVIVDKKLREINNGIAINKTKKWATKNRLYDLKKLEIDKCLWEDAETPRELYARMSEFINNNFDNVNRDIVIVSHGVAIGNLIMSYLNIPCELLMETFIKGNAGGISILSKSILGQRTLNMFNSISHCRK